jgi:hypothetical protein
MSSPDLTDVDYTAMDAEIAQAQADCTALLGQIDPTRASWSRASWSRASWSTSFSKYRVSNSRTSARRPASVGRRVCVLGQPEVGNA